MSRNGIRSLIIALVACSAIWAAVFYAVYKWWW